MEDENKSKVWYSLLEDSTDWNDTNSFSDRAASTFNSSTLHKKVLSHLSSALTNSDGQILSPILHHHHHHTNIPAAAAASSSCVSQILTSPKITNSLTQYSISASDVISSRTGQGSSCSSQSNLKHTNALQSSEKSKLFISGARVNADTSEPSGKLSLQSTEKKDGDLNPQFLKELCESRKKRKNTPASLVFPFPIPENFPHPQNSAFMSGLINPVSSSASQNRRATSALKVESSTSSSSSPSLFGKESSPLDLFDPPLSVRIEPAGRDIAQSNNPTVASISCSTDKSQDREDTVAHADNVLLNPNVDKMNLVIIESALKEQVRYQKITEKSLQHKELQGSSVSSDEETDTDISSKATGYASNLSTLLDYMSVDERVKLLPPSTLIPNSVQDVQGLPTDNRFEDKSPISSDNSPTLTQNRPPPSDKEGPLLGDERSLQPVICSASNPDLSEVDDSILTSVGNRDNFIPVGSESNIQTFIRNPRWLRGMAVGGGGSTSIGKHIDANIHITISKASSTSEADPDALLPIEERERFLPTGADSESLEKTTSSSDSNFSDAEDNAFNRYQSNNIQNPDFIGSLKPSMELVSSTSQLQEPPAVGLLDINIEGAAAAPCKTNINLSPGDYMDVVERETYMKTELRVPFEMKTDPIESNKCSSAGAKPRFKGDFDLDQDQTSVTNSEPDLLLGHSSNFGISGPDLHHSISGIDSFHLKRKDRLVNQKSDLDSGTLLEMPQLPHSHDLTTSTPPVTMPTKLSSFGDYNCPEEAEEDDTDELIKMASSVLLMPLSENSTSKSDLTPTELSEHKSHVRVSNQSFSSTDDAPHSLQANADNVSIRTSNLLTESGRGTLASSDISISPSSAENVPTAGEPLILDNQGSVSPKESSSELNVLNPSSKNSVINVVDDQNVYTTSSHKSLQEQDPSSEILSQTDKLSILAQPNSENNLELPFSVIVKGSTENTSDLSSAHSYDNDQSQDSDVLGRQVNNLLCRTAYLEYKNQNAHTIVTKNENDNKTNIISKDSALLLPSQEFRKLNTSAHPAKNSYTEKGGLNYDQLQQDLTDLQNSLAQGLQLKSVNQPDDQELDVSRRTLFMQKTGHSVNSPDVLQDSKILPENLFQRNPQQADLLLGMDRILRKREEQAFDNHKKDNSTNLALATRLQYNERSIGSLDPVPTFPALADFKILYEAPKIVAGDKSGSISLEMPEAGFVLPNQVSEGDGASLKGTHSLQHSPEVIDDLSLRVERLLSEDPVYEIPKLNVQDFIRPKDRFFKGLSFDKTSPEGDTVPDLKEPSSSFQLPTSKDPVDTFLPNSNKSQENRFDNSKFPENEADGICFKESVKDRKNPDDLPVSNSPDSSHSVGSFMKETFTYPTKSVSLQQTSMNNLVIDNLTQGSTTNMQTNSNSNLLFQSTAMSPSVPCKEQQFLVPPANKGDTTLSEAGNLGHNETFQNSNLVNESSNSAKFLEDDVRRCLDWSNMSTLSSPAKEMTPGIASDYVNTESGSLESVLDSKLDNKPIQITQALNTLRNEQKRISPSSIQNSNASSISCSSSISGKSTTSSNQHESVRSSLNTVCSSSGKNGISGSKRETNCQPEKNSSDLEQTIPPFSNSLVQGATSTTSQSHRNSAKGTSPALCNEDLKQLDSLISDSQKSDNDVYSSSKCADGLPKCPYKLSLSESQPDFHLKNEIPKKNGNKSCSDISSLFHSENPFFKPKEFADSEALKRDLDALSRCQASDSDSNLNSSRKQKKSKENNRMSSCSLKQFSFGSSTFPVAASSLDTKHDPVGTVSQWGDCGEFSKKFDDNRNSHDFPNLKGQDPTSHKVTLSSSSSTSSRSITTTNPSRNNSARIKYLDPTLKRKENLTSPPIECHDNVLTNNEPEHTLNQQPENAHPISNNPNESSIKSSGESSSKSQNQSPIPCETRETTCSSCSTASSPYGSSESVASHKTWTLRPYKPPGSREWYYTDYSECLTTMDSGTTTLESADTGSDDAIGPPFPKEFFGSRVDIPSRPGIYSRLVNKKKIPVREDLTIIQEKSFIDDQDDPNPKLKKASPLHGQYSAKGLIQGQASGNQFLSNAKKSNSFELKVRSRDQCNTFCTPQRLEQLLPKDHSTDYLSHEGPLRDGDCENRKTKTLNKALYLEHDNIERSRQRENLPEKTLVLNTSMVDAAIKNQERFESSMTTTTVNTSGNYPIHPEYPGSDPGQFDSPSTSAESENSQNISDVMVAGYCHPMVRYGPNGQMNSPRVTASKMDRHKGNSEMIQSRPKLSMTYSRKKDIVSQRNERVVRSSKELDVLWDKFQQQDASEHESSMDSERLGHMQKLLKNPTHALVHHTLEKIESIRLKQAEMAAKKMEEQKRVLLCSKIQDDTSSLSASIYTNRRDSSSCSGTGHQGGEASWSSSRPSCTSSDLQSSSTGQQRKGHGQKGLPENKNSGILDPMMAKLRQKIDKQRKKCEQMKMRDKASEQKLRKLTHILVNRQMNDLVMAAEMSSLSTTSTASMATTSETVPKRPQLPNSDQNQPEISQKRTSPTSRKQQQHSQKYPPKERRLNEAPKTRPNQNYLQEERAQELCHCNRPKQVTQRNCQKYGPKSNNPDRPVVLNPRSLNEQLEVQKNRTRKKDAATMVPSPQVASDTTTSDSEDSCCAVKASIGIQTSPFQELGDNSHQIHFFGVNQPHSTQLTKTKAVQNLGIIPSRHNSTCVEETQVIPVPFLSTPKRCKNLANKALYRSSPSNGGGKKTSADKGSEAWFVSLSDHRANNNNSKAYTPQQQQQRAVVMKSCMLQSHKGNKKENLKLNPKRNQHQIVTPKAAAGPSCASVSHAVVPVYPVNGFHDVPGHRGKTLAITNMNTDNTENELTLQEAFYNHMQGWISRSRERQKRIALASQERRYQQQMELERQEMFLNKKQPVNNNNNLIAHPFSDHLHKPKKRVLSKKEMKELNQRLYKKLPEVVQQKVLLNRASEYRTNRIRSRIFSMNVQKCLLTKATSR